MSTTNFSSLNLPPELIKNADSLGYIEMTPIQAQSLPPILEGKDVIGQAKTGSGKTAAFGLGILAKLNVRNTRPQALILCPTRELADQVSNALRQLARMSPNVKVTALCGGQPYRPQVSSLSHGAHIVVGTPGRIAKHLRKDNLRLDDLKILVLDEGDRMLEMGFQDEVDDIIAHTPLNRQTLLFSATYPKAIQSIAKEIMDDPVMIQVESTHDSVSIDQHFYKCGDHPKDRFTALQLLLQKYRPESALIFCTTKQETQDLSDDLHSLGYSSTSLHGDLEQRERDETLIQFSNKSVSILVATDVAARGLDIDSVDTVINYRPSKDVEVHIHRIGRTGRAGAKGQACTLYDSNDQSTIEALEEHLKIKINPTPIASSSALHSSKNDGRAIPTAPMVTLNLRIGKRQKLRAGNILGALTGPTGLSGDQVGKINIQDNWTYVAVAKDSVNEALEKLATETWKGKPIKARRMEA